MEVKNINSELTYQENSVVSKQLIKKEAGNITLFAFDKGEGLSEHTAPFDAYVHVTDGKARITIDGAEYTVSKGEHIIMPADKPHSLYAAEKFKMLLVMIKK